MTITEAIRELLLTFENVTSLVADRIYVETVPQEARLPALRLVRVPTLEDTHLRKKDGVIRARIRVESVASTGVMSDAIDVSVTGDGMTTGLHKWHGVVRGDTASVQILNIRPIEDEVQAGYDTADLRGYKVTRDFWAWFRAA